MENDFSLFIEDNVYEVTTQYYELMDRTKRIFFRCLVDNKPPEYFIKQIQPIWENVDHTFMKNRIKELEEMIKTRDFENRKVINPNAIFKEFFKLNPESKFIETEIEYIEKLSKMYQMNYKTVQNEFIDKTEYLSNNVQSYNKKEATIPYFNKNGTIRAYHNVASYCSMLYNVNMTKSGWNRTFYDADLLDNDLTYLVAHPFACPLCIEAQGKVYSISGKSKKYPKMEWATDGTIGKVGHPNCRHQWTLYWEESQIQEDKFNSSYWQEEYQRKQKKRALDLQLQRLENDKSIYKTIGDNSQVDKTKAKIKRVIEEIKKLS